MNKSSNLLQGLFGQPKRQPVKNLDKDRSLTGKKRVKARRREHREAKNAE